MGEEVEKPPFVDRDEPDLAPGEANHLLPLEGFEKGVQHIVVSSVLFVLRAVVVGFVTPPLPGPGRSILARKPGNRGAVLLE
jgi:hypothetical protein